MDQHEIQRHVCIRPDGVIEYQSILDRGTWTEDEKDRILTLVEDYIMNDEGAETIDWPGVWREYESGACGANGGNT